MAESVETEDFASALRRADKEHHQQMEVLHAERETADHQRGKASAEAQLETTKIEHKTRRRGEWMSFCLALVAAAALAPLIYGAFHMNMREVCMKQGNHPSECGVP